MVNKRKVKFLLNYMESSNSLCGLFSDMAASCHWFERTAMLY